MSYSLRNWARSLDVVLCTFTAMSWPVKISVPESFSYYWPIEGGRHTVEDLTETSFAQLGIEVVHAFH